MLKKDTTKDFFIFLVIILLLMPVNLLASEVINVWSGEHLKGNYSIKEVTIIKTEKSANSYKMVIKWENGSISKSNLIKKGDKYVDTGSSFGEYQKIDPSGKLRMYDQDGLIYVLPEK